MQALRVHAYGGPEVVRIDDVPRPEPKPGEILVSVKAAAVNPVDWKIREGSMGFLKLQLPFTLGCDLAGVVETGSAAFPAGTEVFAYTSLTRNGAYANYAIVLESEIAPKPKTLGFAEAASVPVAASTAWEALFVQGDLQRGQTILIHGAAGSVGAMAVQLAKWKGARVIGTASGENLGYISKIGADETVDYRGEKFEDKVRDVDFVFDTVGGDTQARSFAVLRKGGTLISTVQPPDEGAAKQHGVTAKMFGVLPDGATLAKLAQLVDSGKLTTRIDTVFPFAQALEALARAESGKAKGKIVLEIS